MKLVYLVIMSLWMVLGLNQITLALTTQKHKSPQVGAQQTKKQQKIKSTKLTKAAEKNKPDHLKLAKAAEKNKPDHLKLAKAAEKNKPDHLKLAKAAEKNKPDHLKLAKAAEKNKPDHLKLAKAAEKNKPEHLKSAKAAEKNKPKNLKLAKAAEKNKPKNLKLAKITEKNKPEHLKSAKEGENNRPEHIKLTKETENNKPEHVKLTKAAKNKKPALLKLAKETKKNKPTSLKIALEIKKNNKATQKPLNIQKANRSLANQLNEIINDADNTAVIGVTVKSMSNKDFLYSHNLYRPLTPASTLKILTAEAALLFLKPEYRFPTQLLTDAQTVKDGVLQGNLYIVLSGDPTLTYNDLVDLILNLRTHQIFAIAGNVYIDNTAYDQSFYGPDWEWKDKGYCYAAPISASIINHNCLPFRVTPGKVAGESARVETSPNFYYPNIRNYVITKSNRASCSVHLSDNLSRGLLEIEGCMQKGKEAWGLSYVVSDVPEYNRALFKSVLNQLAIKIYGTVTFGSAATKSYMIAYHVSEPLSQLIHDMLKKSDNVIAGALFKKLGQLYTHQPGSWENGSFAVSTILSKEARMNTVGLKILDGSGLSPSNLASPSQMMQVLDFAYHHNPTNEAFISALPICGIDGTLKHRMGNIARKVRAKTGTISGVVSLAGYVVSADKEIFAFVIMVNGNKSMTWKYKEIEDRIVTVLARYKR